MQLITLKKELEKIKKDHQKIVRGYEKRDLDTLEPDEIEHYGACQGWLEMSEYLLEKLKGVK